MNKLPLGLDKYEWSPSEMMLIEIIAKQEKLIKGHLSTLSMLLVRDLIIIALFIGWMILR